MHPRLGPLIELAYAGWVTGLVLASLVLVWWVWWRERRPER